MDNICYERYYKARITDTMLDEAAQLFSEHYGVWTENAGPVLAGSTKAGRRVRASRERLHADYLVDGARSVYVRVTVDGRLAGHVLACRWDADGRTVCWVTQLVIRHDFRQQGLATGLLGVLRQHGDDVYGIMSSHPAACLAAAKAFGRTTNPIQLDFIREHLGSILRMSPIRYVREAKPRGSLFDAGDASGALSSADSNFYVNHDEPLEVLARVRESMDWPLGELLDGHEFVLLFEARKSFGPTHRNLPNTA